MAIEYNYMRDEDRGRFKSLHHTRSTTGDGFQHIVVTGVVLLHQKGESESRWRREKVTLHIPLPTFPDKALKLKHWAPFATINAIYNKDISNDSGHAVDGFRILNAATHKFGSTLPLQIDIAIRDTDAWLYRIAYHVTLIAELVEPYPPPPK